MARRPTAWLVEGRFLTVGEVVGPVVLAAAVALLLDLVILRPASWPEVVAHLLGYPLGAVIVFFIGKWLGRRTWPRRGRALARRFLRRTLDDRKGGILFVSDRPDRPLSLPLRVLEVVGFVAGVTILVPAILQLLGMNAALGAGLSGLLFLGAVWGSWVLVPYWLFSRLGVRRVDPVRWIVEPLSRRYGERLRLSNGALLILAAGATVNLAFRAGASGDEALLAALSTVLRVVASSLVIAASAVAYYTLQEKQLLRDFEAEALAMGLKDGRGMSDGDFLPRLRAPAARSGAEGEPEGEA